MSREFSLATAIKKPWQRNPFASTVFTVLLIANITVTASLAKGAPLSIYGLVLLLPVVLVLLDDIKQWGLSASSCWPPWFHVLCNFNLAIGTAVLASTDVALLSLNSPVIGMHAVSQNLILITETIAAFASLAILLPRFCTSSSALVLKFPRAPRVIRKISTPSGIYAFVSTLFGVSATLILLNLLKTNTIPFMFAAAFILTIGFRKTLWNKEEQLWAGLMPHLPAWGIFLLAPFELHFNYLNLYLNEVTIYSLAIGCYILATAGAIFWYAQRLRSAPVKKIEQAKKQQADSISSKENYYVDERKLSKQLRNAIERSDGGVFGITGVRGAGKSALMRHVLYEFRGSHNKEGYFTTEVTAPSQHDDNMGFFITVCRNVCRKVIDDLEPIIRGRGTSSQSRLSSQIRNASALVLGIIGAGIFTINLNYTDSFYTSKSFEGFNAKMPFDILSDPLLGETLHIDALPLIAERKTIDNLLLQINKITSSETEPTRRSNAQTNFLLLPNPASQQFWLLRQRNTLDPTEEITRYRGKTRLFIDSYEFYLPQKSIEKTKWENSIQRAKNIEHVAAPLLLISKELQSYLVSDSSILGANDNKSHLLSELLIKAYLNSDPKLSFDFARLERFVEAVRVYRHLLDGEVFATSTSEQNIFATRDLDLLNPTSSASSTALWVIAVLIILLFVARPAWLSAVALTRTAVNRRYLDAYIDAQNFMEQLAYKSSQESSAGFSFKGINLGRKKTLANRDFTIPGLTARYTQFLHKILPLYNGKLIIGIDELDKIHDPEQVKGLLSEIKGALFMEGTYYLLSISEDAARSFRRRLASGRDIFESTFDDVVDIPQMDVQPAVEMLILREKTGEEENRLPIYSLVIAALFGGGIPREIIRARRTLSYAMKQQEDATPAWAVYTLLEEELCQWERHIGEANLSGTDTVKLRNIAHKTRELLQQSPEQYTTYENIWHTLEPCIEIVDPDGLRNSVGYIAEEPINTDEISMRYRQIAEDLQVVLRLMILTHLGELILSNIDYRQFDRRILNCHKALSDKPALAETLMRELRDDQNTYKKPDKPITASDFSQMETAWERTYSLTEN